MLAFKIAKGLVVAGLLSFGLHQSAFATTYYLSPTGNDYGGGGTTIATALRTLNRAEQLVKPGDTVYALDGDYTDPYGYNALYATVAGKPGAWIKFKAYPGAHPTIHNAYWQAIEITASVSYFEFSGFEIIGNNLNVTLAEAQAQPQYGAPQFNDVAIYVDGSQGSGTNYPNHIVIRDNNIHNCGGGESRSPMPTTSGSPAIRSTTPRGTRSMGRAASPSWGAGTPTAIQEPRCS